RSKANDSLTYDDCVRPIHGTVRIGDNPVRYHVFICFLRSFNDASVRILNIPKSNCLQQRVDEHCAATTLEVIQCPARLGDYQPPDTRICISSIPNFRCQLLKYVQDSSVSRFRGWVNLQDVNEGHGVPAHCAIPNFGGMA